MDRFDEFWEYYPRRDDTPRIGGKKQARQRLLKIVGDGEATWDEIVSGVRLYAQCDKVTGKSSPTGIKYICMPKTWIGQARWEDEYEPAPIPFEQKTPDEYTDEDWRTLLGEVNHPFRLKNFSVENWSPYLGPRPPHPDSIVPITIQDEYRRWWPDLRVVDM